MAYFHRKKKAETEKERRREQERKSLRGQRQRHWVCEGVGEEADD